MSNDILIGAYKILRKLGAEQAEIKPETNFYSDLFFDETDRTCLLFFMESHFNIDVSEQEAEEMKTVNDMLEIVAHHKKALMT